ncbi:uncharacterized protein [Phaseolus vulgaris]|uniref:uncharacterized protein n=1 Tax=Phaseolus vulgaris TaxID=3885 RepID=UPI0035CA5ADF
MENPPSASTPFLSVGEGPPSTASIAEAAPGGDECAHDSPILITESPTSPPRQEAQLHQPIQEGGGESQHQAPSAPPPTAAANPPPVVKEIWGPFTAKLKMMAEDLPSIITKAVESSNKKLQDDICTLQEENRLIRIEAEKLSCNLMMAEIDHSRVEDAMSAELRVARKEASDLRQKLHLLAQEKIELESKLVPYRLKVANLEASMKADATKVENLEKRSVDREVLLGRVERERDDAVDELAKAREENEKIAAELAQARGEGKKVADDLAQARGETEELKKRADELKQQTEGLKKTPQVVQEDEEEDDEATEAPSSPPALPTPTPPSPPAPTPPSPPAPTPPVQAIPLAAALPAVEGNEPNFMENPLSASTPFVSAGEGPPSTASIAEAAPGGDEGAHNSPILITESPTSPPRQEAQLHQPIQEGGGESQHQAPSAPPPPPAPRGQRNLGALHS